MGGAGQNGRKLRSIIAVLGSMAAKADIAAGRAFAVRWLVLFFLRFAECVVQVYVASALQIEPGDLENELAPVAGPADASPADAVLLAWRLRWYATVLTALLDRLVCSDGRLACRAGARLAMAGGDMAGFPLPRFNDTS